MRAFPEDRPFKIIQTTEFLFGGFAKQNISVISEASFTANNLSNPERGQWRRSARPWIIHQWWGLGAQLMDPEDPYWTDEGITTYTTYRLMKKEGPGLCRSALTWTSGNGTSPTTRTTSTSATPELPGGPAGGVPGTAGVGDSEYHSGTAVTPGCLPALRNCLAGTKRWTKSFSTCIKMGNRDAPYITQQDFSRCLWADKGRIWALRKIFYYQCRRLLCNKLFWGLLAVILWVQPGGAVRHSHPGECATPRPFPWSFGYYLTFLLPFLCAAELFFLSFYTSPSGGGWRYSPAATLSPQALFLLPDGGIGGRNRTFDPSHPLDGRSLHARMFRWDSFGELLAPAVLSWSPPFSSFGAGWFLGNLRHVLLYPLIALPFLCAYLPLPRWLDPVGGASSSPIPWNWGTGSRLLPSRRMSCGAGWD